MKTYTPLEIINVIIHVIPFYHQSSIVQSTVLLNFLSELH
jgi:hypothetical protein